MALYGVLKFGCISLNWDINNLSLANASISLGRVIISPAAEPIKAMKMPMFTASMPIFPIAFSDTSDKGAELETSIFHGITPNETTATRIPIAPTTIVPHTIALGIIFSGSSVSSAR